MAMSSVTSVGGTQLSGTLSETAVLFSSGGFSNYFPKPSYQDTVVESYLSSFGSTDNGLFNVSGRAFPDVAAMAVNLSIVVDGEFVHITGTSCSSPIFASVIALINDALATAGNSPLGFLNPFLYANPDAFHDITSGTDFRLHCLLYVELIHDALGSNPGCGTNGFSATKGWDPITGLGTPDFAALKAAAGV